MGGWQRNMADTTAKWIDLQCTKAIHFKRPLMHFEMRLKILTALKKQILKWCIFCAIILWLNNIAALQQTWVFYSSQDFVFQWIRQKIFGCIFSLKYKKGHFKKGQTVYSRFTKPGRRTLFPFLHPTHHGLVQIIWSLAGLQDWLMKVLFAWCSISFHHLYM